MYKTRRELYKYVGGCGYFSSSASGGVCGFYKAMMVFANTLDLYQKGVGTHLMFPNISLFIFGSNRKEAVFK